MARRPSIRVLDLAGSPSQIGTTRARWGRSAENGHEHVSFESEITGG